MLENTYTGVGSREVPPDVYRFMYDLGYALARAGWRLRSGGAPGADTAFEEGARAAQGEMDIYLPWKGFNDNPSTLYGVCAKALALAKTVHPAWDDLSSAARKLHSRNCYQVLGRTLDEPAVMVICWTDDGCTSEAKRRRGTGGTGTAIVLADRHDVPVFNLKNDTCRTRLNTLLEQWGVAYQVPLTPRVCGPAQGALF